MTSSTFVRPTYAELSQRIAADLQAVPAVLRTPLAAALGKAAHGEYAYLEWIHDQCSPLTCELERLADWADLYSVERLQASKAAGYALFTGTAGAQVLQGATLRGQTNELDYSVSAAVTLGTGSTAVAVVCTTAGVAGNLAAGQVLTLIDPIAGVDSTAMVAVDGLTGGAELEDVDDWRARVVSEWMVITADGGRAGKPADYVYWAKSAHASVSGALVQKHLLGLGTVVVRPICNALAQRQPSASVLAAVQAMLAIKAPATADWRVTVPNVQSVAVVLDLAASVDNTANRASISAALSALIDGKLTDEETVTLAELDAAVALTTTSYTRSAPVADVQAAAGEVLVFGGVTFL